MIKIKQIIEIYPREPGYSLFPFSAHGELITVFEKGDGKLYWYREDKPDPLFTFGNIVAYGIKFLLNIFTLGLYWIFASQTKGRVKCVDFSKEDIEYILHSQELKQENIIDKKNAVLLKKLKGTRAIVHNNITETQSKRILKEIEYDVLNPGYLQLYYNNCTTYVERWLDSASLPHSNSHIPAIAYIEQRKRALSNNSGFIDFNNPNVVYYNDISNVK